MAILYGLMLIVAAHGKASNPWMTASLLGLSGEEMSSGAGLVDAATILEAGIGAALVVAPRWRVSAVAGLVAAVVFVVLQAWRGGTQCGCFGSLAVPGGLKWTLVAAGATACACLILAGRPVSGAGSRPRVAAAMMLIAIGSLPILTRQPLDPDPGPRLARVLGSETTANTLVVVGAWSCPDCKRVLDALAARTDPRSRNLRVVFAHRASDQSSATRDLGRFVVRAIPDSLWWSFVRGEPPTFVRLLGDGRFEIERSLDAALRRS